MLKQVFLAHFEPEVMRFGPWKIPKSLENGSFWDPKWVKNGSKTRFPKSDCGRFGMLRQVFFGFDPPPPRENAHIYSLIYTPLPNCMWLHHTALRYVRSVQLGPYMWRKGLSWVKPGSKWAQFICLWTPNGPPSLLEKRVFEPFLTDLWSRNAALSRHFGISRAQNASPRVV